MEFPAEVEFNDYKAWHESRLKWQNVPTGVIYHIESVKRISIKFVRSMVVSLVDKNGKALKVFSTRGFEIDLTDFSQKEKWFIRQLGKQQSSRNPSRSYYHYEIVQQHQWSAHHLCHRFFILVDTKSQYLFQLDNYCDYHVLTMKFS